MSRLHVRITQVYNLPTPSDGPLPTFCFLPSPWSSTVNVFPTVVHMYAPTRRANTAHTNPTESLICVPFLPPQDRKADLEEEKLSDIHPAYKTYKEEVSKFVPTLY